MKVKLNVLLVLSILAAIGVITLQISWLKTSYQITREKIRLDWDAKLEQAIAKQKDKAEKRLSLKIISALKSKASFYFEITDKDDTYKIGYNGPNGKLWSIPPLFRLTEEEEMEAKRDSYGFLIKRIERANIKELKYILDNALGPHDMHISTGELYELFNFYSDTTTLLNSFNNSKLAKSFSYKIKYYDDAEYLFDILPVDSYTHNLLNYELSVGEKLDSIENVLNKVNNRGGLICILKPVFNDDNLLSDHIPVILLTIEVSKANVLGKMIFSLVGSVLLFILLGFCLTYMFYTILKQKKLSEIKDDFISNVSHELKTPLATTFAAIQGMQHFDVLKDEEKTEQYLRTAAKEMKRLSIMVDTILNSSIYERSDFNLHLVKINLKEMLMEMISIQESHAKKEVKIELNYLASKEILADKTHIYNVFINLIDNAIKYGKESVIIKIDCIDNDRGIRIRVTDNGNGIPVAYQKNIFDKFFRVPSPTDHSIKGHGLGLNYAKNIIEKLNGTINLLKSDANGSTFEINLPQ